METPMTELYYKPIYPNWYGSYVEVENLELIKNELLELFFNNVKSNGNKLHVTGGFYYLFKKDLNLDKCVNLTKFLQDKFLMDRLWSLMYITEKTTKTSVPHVDTYDPRKCLNSFNIPLTDYEDSYTAFFETSEKYLNASNQNIERRSQFAWLEKEKVREVKRLKTIKPAIINTTILHMLMTDNEKRTVCSLRFTPALGHYDLIRLGIKNPFCQED